jgi:periplasmic divalent cation tolerance protein
MDDRLVVFVTTESKAEARRIARTLLEQKLVACVNILPVDSVFVWEAEVQAEQEALMIIKTRRDVFDRLEAAIKAAHSYDTPEIIAVPIVLGSHDYLQWIDDEVTG